MRVVGNDTESCVCSVLFHYAAKSHLCRGCHGVGFVEDDEFIACHGGCGIGFGERGEDLFCAAEGLDLFAGRTRLVCRVKMGEKGGVSYTGLLQCLCRLKR